MNWKPLGDQAVLFYFPGEAAAAAFAGAVRAQRPPWLHDVVPAYASAGVFFDADAVGTAEVVEWLGAWVSTSPRLGGERSEAKPPGEGNHLHPPGISDTRREAPTPSPGDEASPTSPPQSRGRGDCQQAPSRQHVIPVCYELQLDAPRVCEHTGLAFDDIIRLHTSAAFSVYAVGFVPGFPYMGYLPAELCGVPRLASPRTRVEPGSVGVTGRQTAVYPAAVPGGWTLIGRTPLVIVDVADGFFPIRVGDAVTFERIDERRFAELSGERL